MNFKAQIQETKRDLRRFLWLVAPACVLLWLVPSIYAVHLVRIHAPTSHVLWYASLVLLGSAVGIPWALWTVRNIHRPACPHCLVELAPGEWRVAAETEGCPRCGKSASPG